MAILAAGGIIWRRQSDSEAIEVLLVHRPRYHDWTFPKGKLHKGESLLAAAIREVSEETGLSVVVGHRMPTVGYRTIDGPKEVTYWAMRPTGGEFEPNHEVDRIRWVPITRASRKLTYAHDRRLADDWTQRLPSAVRVLLVRHGDAGHRSDFSGPDIERPLSERGLRQAQRLVALLSAFGPTDVLSAPALRCIQTVEPLARATGLAVQRTPMFGEEEFTANPREAADRLQAFLAAGDTDRRGDANWHPDRASAVTVIASQGGVIPALMTAISPSGDPEARSQVAAKAGVWALAVGAGLVRADYYRPLKA